MGSRFVLQYKLYCEPGKTCVTIQHGLGSRARGWARRARGWARRALAAGCTGCARGAQVSAG